VAHFGDFGQPALRPEQRAALGRVDIVFFPAGGGPTTPVDEAAALLRELAPRVVVPMHFRTEPIGFLDPVDPFLAALELASSGSGTRPTSLRSSSAASWSSPCSIRLPADHATRGRASSSASSIESARPSRRSASASVGNRSPSSSSVRANA
jgi:beta-lactamase family protein